MIFLFVKYLNGLQHSSQCVPVSSNPKYQICSCINYQSLQCDYRKDLLELNINDIDRLIRPIIDFNLKMRSYFPNLKLYPNTYEQIELNNFPHVPKNAFYDQNTNELSSNIKKYLEISLQYTNENIIDLNDYAFSYVNTKVLSIEGTFDFLMITPDTFRKSKIDLLTISCFKNTQDQNKDEFMLNDVDDSDKQTMAHECNLQLPNKIDKSNENEIKSIRISGLSSFHRQQWNICYLPNILNVNSLTIINTRNHMEPLKSIKCQDTTNDDTIIKLNMLKELDLRQNSIETIDSNSLESFVSIEILVLSSNNINNLHKSCFNWMSKTLETLNLDSNNLTELHSDVFSTLKQLKILNLKNNYLKTINKNLFKNLNKLQTLDLSYNQIKHLYGYEFIIEPTSYSALRNLNLAFNPYLSIDNTTFYKIANSLEILDLRSNQKKNWFYFDNSDVCLLAAFKCNTKIITSQENSNSYNHLNCNCFNINNYYIETNNLSKTLVECFNKDYCFVDLIQECFNKYSSIINQNNSCLFKLLTNNKHKDNENEYDGIDIDKETSTVENEIFLSEDYILTTTQMTPELTSIKPSFILNNDESVEFFDIGLKNYLLISLVLSLMSLLISFILTISFISIRKKFKKEPNTRRLINTELD